MENLRIALQSKGRLNEKSLDILRNAGIRIEESSRRLLTMSENFPLEVLYLRDDDIPQTVSCGIADIGIVGLNEVEERGFDVKILKRLKFGKCRLSLAVPKTETYTGLSYFEGKRIATSYPNILRRFFEKNSINCEIREIAGSVEIAPSIGMADGIFDIVSSGGTLVSNGLAEVEVVMHSEAVLIASPSLDECKDNILEEFMFRLESVMLSKGKKYMLVNIPNDKVEEALEIIPSMKSPTLLPLADKEWSAIHAVVEDDDLWKKSVQLKKIGAEDILVLSLEKVIL